MDSTGRESTGCHLVPLWRDGKFNQAEATLLYLRGTMTWTILAAIKARTPFHLQDP